MKILKFLPLVLLLTLLVTTVEAKERKGMQKNGTGMCEQTKLQDLGLSSDQISKMIEIKKESRNKSRGLKQELDKARDEFQDEMEKDKLDEKKVKSLAEKVGNLHKEMMLERFATFQEIKKILTKEQLDKLEFFRLMRPMDGNKRGGAKGKRQGSPAADQD